MMPIAPVFISPEWLNSKTGQEIYSSLLNKSLHNRRPFGLLERPTFAPQHDIEEFEYKLFISGKSGVGKTATVCKLSANPLPVGHSETPGIQTSVVYWPAHIKNIDKIILFKLQLWDSGEHLLKKFDHILPACTEKVDGIFFTFSFTDKPSFEDLPQQMSRISSSDNNYCRFIIGTKLDLPQSEVTQREIEEFEETWKLPILGIQNTNEVHSFAGNDFRGDMKDVAPLMNYICDELWKRDQILAGNTSVKNTESSMKY